MISELSISSTIRWLLLLSLTAHQIIAATANQSAVADKPATMSHQRLQQPTSRNFTATKPSQQSLNNVVEHGMSVTDAIPKPIPLALPVTNAILLLAENSKDGKRKPTTAIKVNRMMRRVRKSLLPTTAYKSVAVNRTTALRSFNSKYRRQQQDKEKEQEQEREQQKHKSHKQPLQQKPKVKERIVGVEVTEHTAQTNTQQSINDNVTVPNAITTQEVVHQQDTQRNTSWAPMIVYPVNSNAGSGYIEFDMNRNEEEDYRNHGGQHHNETRQATIQEMLSNLFPKGFSDILRFSNMQDNEPTSTESPPAPVWIPPKVKAESNPHDSRRFHQKYRRDLSNLYPINKEKMELHKLSRSPRSADAESIAEILALNDSAPIEVTSEAASTKAQQQDNDLAESEINEIEYKPSESLHYQTFPNHNITIHIIHDNPSDEDDETDDIDDDKSYFKAHFKTEFDSTNANIDDENINSASTTKLMTHQALRDSSSSKKTQKFNAAWRNRETFLKPPPPVATIDAKRKYRNFQRIKNPRTSSTSSANENFDYKTKYRTLNRNTETGNVSGRNSTTPVNVMFVTFNSASKAKTLNPTQIPTMTPMYPNLTPQDYVTERKFGSKYNKNNNKTKTNNNKTNTDSTENTYTSVEIQKSINIHNKLIREQDGKLLEEREEFPNGTVIINPIKEAANASYNSTQKRATQITYGLLSQHPILVEGDEHDDSDSTSIEDERDVESAASTNNEEHVPAPNAEVEQTEVEAIQQTQPIQEFHIIEYVQSNPNTHQVPSSVSANYPVNVHLVEDMTQQQTHGQTSNPQYSDVNIIPPPLAPNFVQNSYTMPGLQSSQSSQTPQQMEQMVGHPPVLPMLVALPYPLKNPNTHKHPNVPSSADNIINKSLPLDRPPPLLSPPSKKYKVIPHYPIVNANPPPPWPPNFHPPNYLPANGPLNPFNALHKYFNKLFHKAPSNGLQVFPFHPKSKQIPVNFIKSGNTLKYEFLRSLPPASANLNPSLAFYDANRDKLNHYISDYNSLPRDLTSIHTVIQNQKPNKRLLPAHKENGTIEGRNGQQLKRSPSFGRNLHVEYGFKPPLIPSVEINEEGIPLKSVGASLANDLV